MTWRPGRGRRERRGAGLLAGGLALLSGGCALWAPATPPSAPALRDLPLVERPAPEPAPGRPHALLLTGDAGWTGVTRALADELIGRGVSVTGWNSLRYYWRARTPDEAARDLARVLDHHRRTGAEGPLLLVGYSFGADVLPFLVNRLPPALRREVASVTLVGASPGATFQFFVPGWLGYTLGRVRRTRPEVERLGGLGVPVLCVNGKRERARACDGLDAPRVQVLLLPTGHRFQGFAPEIADRIVATAGG